MDNDYRIEDFPKEGDINWREFAEHFGIETALKFLDLYGGQKIWVLSPSNVRRARNERLVAQPFVSHGTDQSTP